MGHRIEQGAQDARPRDLELAPQLVLRTSLCLRDGRQGQKNGAVGEIGRLIDILDAVQEDRAGGLKQHLLLVGVELPDREAAAAREPAERVGEPSGQAGQIVECQHMAVVGGNEELALLARQARTGAALGSTSALSIFDSTVLAEPCSPEITRSG